MRQAPLVFGRFSVWVGCLVLVCSLACRGSAPAPSGTSGTVEARLTSPCSGTTCTITFNQAGTSCSVDPPSLAVASGDTVIFATQVSAQTAAVVITPKAASSISFQNGPPGRINRGSRHDSGMATGSARATYTYAVRFAGPSNQNVCPPIDPVICIKPGGVEPGSGDLVDTCE